LARRVSMPTADDLFRPTDPTSPPAQPLGEPSAPARVRAVPDEPEPIEPEPTEQEPAGPPRPSGRVRHDEKMTVYVTSAELLHLEQSRLRLRAEHGLAVDRGRLVREALALVLAEFEVEGEDSSLVKRLTEE
jgi:hypothetical protein